MNHIEYDFSALLQAFNNMKQQTTATPEILATLKKELNEFFEDSKCKEVLYTNNVDKMFFGMKVHPVIDADDIFDLISDDEPKRINEYIVEIDSKLIDPVTNLSANELLAILLHEVHALIGDTTPMENARNALNVYLASNREYISITKSIHYKEILAYGLKDYLSKSGSMFYMSDSMELASDEFAHVYFFVEYLVKAYDKISYDNIKLYEDSQLSKFVVFSWTLSLYRHMKTRRVGAIRTLTRAMQLTGSRIEKMEMDNVIKRIKRIDDDVLVESADSSIRMKIKEKLRKARLNNLRTIDSTYYELAMQIRNVEDENDALYLMRQINNNISVIDGYRNSADCDPYEIDKWNQAYDRFCQLRDKLSSTVVYKNKQYGLFVNYPDIVENRY